MRNIFEKISQVGIVPVVKLTDTSKALHLAQALIEGGINCAEITFRAQGADKVIAQIATNFPDMVLGAGTVLSIEQADRAMNSGASFCVAPAFNEKLVQYCCDKQIPFIPGVATATEVDNALCVGLDHVKFFPAEQTGGIAYIKAICAPYQNVYFMPTGGISLDNMAKYLSFNRIFAVGGSFMVKNEYLQEGDWKSVTEQSKAARAIVTASRGE